MVRRRSSASALALALAAFCCSGPPGAPAAALEDAKAQCVVCHGADGRSDNPDIPHIGAQPKLFVMYQLFFYREARRKSAEMNAVAQQLSDADLSALADYVASLPPPPPASNADQDRYLRGAALAGQRACAVCHNPDYSGREQMPRLAGQREGYLLRSLTQYQQGERIGTQAAMAEAVRGLGASELADLAHYLAHFRQR
jgi:cytochrome c553